MRLSDVPGDRALETLADIVVPCVAIMQDEEVVEAFTGLAAGGTDRLGLVKALAPTLLKSHGPEVYQVLAAINGKSEAEYRTGSTLASVLRDAYEVLSDDQLLDFLSPVAAATE